MLKHDIEKREQNPISFNQIKLVLRDKADPSFVVLDSLKERPTDEEIFQGKDCACILCTLHKHSKPTDIRHWVALIKRTGYYTWFDSLGNTIPQLTHLLGGKESLMNWASTRKIDQTSKKLQKWDSHVNTCGAHISARLIKKKLDSKAYSKWLTHSFLNPDLSVALLCFFDLIHKD